MRLIQLFLLIIAVFLSIPALSSNVPCSGAKGGVSHCNGSSFVCHDGSISGSKKICSANNALVQQKDFFVDAGGKSSDAKVRVDRPAEADDFQQKYPIVKRVAELLQVDYPGFTLWVDCAKRGAVKFQYVAHRDNGSIKRDDDFFIDHNIPASCQQISSSAYGNRYDRGHLVPANHMDNWAESIHMTNSMANIWPQAANMNRGAWYFTEELVECYRDIDELLVIGGVLWDSTGNSLFMKSHQIETPSAFWKVIIRGTGQDERVIAWLIPNSQEATIKNLDKYLISIEKLEKIIGQKIPVADYAKYDSPKTSWLLPYGCNKG
jgi:endonuclease G